jgi:hypothetical protein
VTNVSAINYTKFVWSVLTQTWKFNLIVMFGHHGWTEALTARMCIIPSHGETNTIISWVILLYSVWKCFFTCDIKLSHKIYDVILFRTPSYLCVCTTLHVCTFKIIVFLVTEFIYDKTALFIIISVYITADVYFGCVINCCEADILKFVAPGWIV